MGKRELLEGLRREEAQFRALLDEIGEGRMEQPDVAGGWSVKDIVAHLTGWRRRTVGRLQAALRGEGDPPTPWPAHLTEDDDVNAWIYERGRGQSLAEVLADSRRTFDELAAALEAFPEAELADPHRFPWWDGTVLTAEDLYGHFHEEHEPDLRAWLARQAA